MIPELNHKTKPGWIDLAYSVRRSEGIKQAEAILLRAQAIHPKVAMIAFTLACYASVTGRMEDANERLRNAIELDKDDRLRSLAACENTGRRMSVKSCCGADDKRTQWPDSPTISSGSARGRPNTRVTSRK